LKTNTNNTTTTTDTSSDVVVASNTLEEQQSPPKDLSLDSQRTWGPCYPPLNSRSNNNDWDSELQLLAHGDREGSDANSNSNTNANLPYARKTWNPSTPVAGLCRPGFLIIGAGKCGTSSLYHYLVGHPRVLPAYTKQIHYFKVRTNHYIKKGRQPHTIYLPPKCCVFAPLSQPLFVSTILQNH
jgi:hypothetical protein